MGEKVNAQSVRYKAYPCAADSSTPQLRSTNSPSPAEQQEGSPFGELHSPFAACKFPPATVPTGIPAYVVVPRTAPRCKQAAIHAYGATLVPCEPSDEVRKELGGKQLRTRFPVLLGQLLCFAFSPEQRQLHAWSKRQEESWCTPTRSHP